MGALINACAPAPAAAPLPPSPASPSPAASPTSSSLQPPASSLATPLPTRTRFGPGAPLPYRAQSGDSVPAVAAHFNTTAAEILAANPGLSPTQTLTSGVALTIPAYYFPLGGSPFQIIPDSEFVYGPAQKDFDLRAYLAAQPGSLKTLSGFANQQQRDAAGVIDYVARQYSLNPRLLLALAEWRSGAVTQPAPQPAPFGRLPAAVPDDWYLQLVWMAEQLNLGYYGWRAGTLLAIRLPDEYRMREDAYQNAGTVAVHYLLAQIVPRDQFEAAIGPDGFAAAYRALWGDPWAHAIALLPGNLAQPALTLPFEPRQTWTFTGAPHAAWGAEGPWGALDFAPAGVSQCETTAAFATAVGAGRVARSGDSTVVLDLDGDGYEGTGWDLFYFHMAERDMAPAGRVVQAGDPLGHPSCEGGRATGTHLHIARKYNGEWLLAGGVVPFDLGGWVAQSEGTSYQGRLMRLGAWVEASTNSTAQNRIYWVP